jgi:protein-disulfide isomerase
MKSAGTENGVGFRQSRSKRIFDLSITALQVIVCLNLLWLLNRPTGKPPAGPTPTVDDSRRQREDQPSAGEIALPTMPIDLGMAAIKGRPDAKLILALFSDFQCPYCAVFASQTMPSVEEQFVTPGFVQLAFVHTPIERIHPLSFQASSVAECAREEGQFWEVHDALFQKRGKFDQEFLSELPLKLAIPQRQFGACMARQEVSDRVRSASQLGRDLGIRGTPTFLLGTRVDGMRMKVLSRWSGAQPLQRFRAEIEPLLK